MEKISYQIKIEEAKYLSDFLLELRFTDGVQKVVDLKNELTGVFEPLQDLNKFKDFKLVKGVLCWDEDLDFAPEFLRYVCNDLTPQLIDSKQ